MTGSDVHHHAHQGDHRSSFHLPPIIPTPSLVESVAGGAHYSGAKSEHHDGHFVRRRSSSRRRSSVVMELSDKRKQVLEDLKELFCCRPTKAIFDRSWREDADPLCHCRGRQECAAQSKLALKSENLSTRVISSTVSPNRVVFSQKQEYTFRILGKKSMVVVDLDEDERIVRLSDQWDGEEPSASWLARSFRRLNAKMAKWTVKIPKVQR
ncbi:hypothetical protein GLOTRDRAFT_37104 [Gloeophyllum trabeum ATCC 11539]|uniref:Uncharacterized protein n=1 Tax=Gloeophyllum trabeum (strain ATCC 11539 / FP-39264 / Madison 617) TaxID=670483 RepID=S7RYH9_GLOTA|nr:uncharacterized protein GLOTRDRAFT_37104 [Gloeophyllum trabeum ATCC 11539]EPQ58459.1 hypothetical protein GLOTRDRAFT_37104 [Gloeophyllum trabeum ATCC 11539]